MKDILIVGAGRIGTVIADLLAGTGDYAVTVADRDSAAVERIGTGTLTTGQTETLLFTTSEVANLEESRITVIKGGTLSNLGRTVLQTVIHNDGTGTQA